MFERYHTMKHTLSVVLLILSFTIARAQDTLTVGKAVERVLQTHPALLQARASVVASEARSEQTESARYPELASEATYTRIGPVPAFSFPVFGTIVLAPADNYDAHVSARYTVFDFGKTGADIDLSRSRIQSVRDAADLTETNLSLQTVRTFYAVVYLRKSAQVQIEQIDALNRHLSVSRKRVADGSATNFDVLTTEVRVASAQNQAVEIRNSLQKQEAILRQLLGLPAGDSLVVRGAFDRIGVSLNTDSLTALALSARPEMRAAHDAETSAHLQEKVSSVGNMPALKVSAGWGVKNGFEPNIDAIRGNWYAAVKAEIPLLNGGRTAHQEEESRALVEAEQAHRRDVERFVRSDVEQSIADVQAAVEKVRVTEVQLNQAEDAVSIARTRYETGSITNLDLLDAETAESASRLSNLQALYRLVISKYELDRAVGTPVR